MRKFILLFISLCLFVSCKSIKDKVDFDYLGESNYENFYLVDTIKIVKPVLISSKKFGGKYIVSEQTLEKYDETIKFFSRSDVFIYGDDLYRILPLKRYKDFKYPKYEDCDKFEFGYLINNELSVYKLKTESDYFLLGLINSNYYYQKHNGFHNNITDYIETDYKRVYYKIVFPYCK